jgi:putative membrane protein
VTGEPVGRRLDPRTLVSRVLTLAALRRQWGLVVGLVAVLGLRGGFRAAGLAAAVLAVLALSALSGALEWLRTTYAVDGGRLVVERGLLRRSLTVVPVDRVRGVDVEASALQRLLGIASVRVDAAATGGRGDEAVLDSVSAADAQALRDVLLRQAAAARAVPPGAPAGPPTSVGPGGPTATAGGAADPGGRSMVGAPADGPGERGEPGEVLARFHPAWLRYAPLVGGYLLAPVAALGAVAQLLDDVHLPLLSEERLDALLDELLGDRPTGLVVALLVLAAALLAALGAVVTAAVVNWGFTLTRRGGTLVAERGLLSRRQVSLEHDRVRGYALAEPLALRAVGAARLTALVTGLGGEGEGARGRRGQLLPLGPAGVARQVAAAAVLPFRVPLRRHPPAARRRRLVRAVVPWLVLAAALAVPRLWPGVLAALALAGLGVPLGLDRYAGLGHALDERALSVRSGSLRRTQVVLSRRGVVGWTVRQSWFQRRAGLATVTVATGAGSGGYDAVDLDATDAVRLMREADPRRVAPLVAETRTG